MKPLDSEDPRALGPHRLVARIGAGGMGTVYAARTNGGALIAVKTVHPEYAGDPEFRARFAREIALIRRVRSPYVPLFFGSDLESPTPWLATEYVSGPTLRSHVRENGPLDPARLAAFAAASAEALRAIHGAGVVHRDLKPGNVILSPDGPKILDFGIAHLPDETGLTRTGGLVGTPGWTSPERYRGASATDRSDVFAWGGLVAFAGTGRPPFGTGNPAVLAHRVAESAPDVDGLPPAFHDLVIPALHKDPDLRPTAAAVLRASLRLSTSDRTPGGEADDDTELTTSIVTRSWTGFVPDKPPEQMLRSPGRLRRPLLVAAGAAAALALGAAGTVVAVNALDGEARAPRDVAGEENGTDGGADGTGEGDEGADGRGGASDAASSGSGDGADAGNGAESGSAPPPGALAEGENAGYRATAQAGLRDEAQTTEVGGAWSEPAQFMLSQSTIDYSYIDVLKADRSGDTLTFTLQRTGRGSLGDTGAVLTIATGEGDVSPEAPYDSGLAPASETSFSPYEVSFADAPDQGLLAISDPGFREDIVGFPTVGICYDLPEQVFSTDFDECL
ncbi:serine/threonine-protein kinase [Nocardiopsis halophila]|uniref:serine/threonine-protein kinase n=1 Tax=Nocardiopsis halophila TaxID=141692 RepID=UPI0003478F05|nr:serine/threonine-protein kinase [Nocardiopsis halophila]